MRHDGLLAEFARNVADELDLHDVLSCVLRCAAELTGAAHLLLGVQAMPGAGATAEFSDLLQHDPFGARLMDRLDGERLLAGLSTQDLPAKARYQGRPVLGLAVCAGATRLGLLALLLPDSGTGQVAPAAVMDALQVLTAHAGLAIRNAARIARERRRTARFQLVAKVAQIINRSGSPLMTTLQMAADAIHDVLEYPNVDIPLVDPDDPGVLVILTRGGGYKQIGQEDRIRIDQGIMGAAARTRKTILANDVQSDPRYVRPPVPNPSRAELAVPLLSGDELLGVLNVEGDGPFDELDQLTIEAIARHLALAIENAALVSEQQNNAIMEERQRLAYELHDSVTQALSGISLLAQALPSAWDKGRSEGLRASARVAELAQLAVAEMRTLLHELSAAQRQNQTQRSSRRMTVPVGLDQLKDGGLGAALPKLLGVLVPPQIKVSCDFSAYVAQHLEYEQALYRVFQEAASNLVRHSGASALTLVAQVDTRLVQVSMRDNGRGVGSETPDGYGFRSMRQRLQRLGGALRLRSLQPCGFEVLATLKRRDRILSP
jgi:signal transduction histidine kinase